jgi:CheY-like chemotaxis protein
VQLEQVIFNLCINARDAIDGPGVIRVRAGPDEGGWTCASCRTHVRGGRWIELSVADSGAGVAPEVAGEIFQPFVTTKPVGQGSGMGLAMVDGIIHGHGGHVRFESRPGEGSVFRVLLPAVDEDVVASAAPAVPDAAAPKRLDGRVLVVEDDAMAGDFLVERLANWGLAVTLERDPRLAVTRLENPGFAIDLVLTDQTMPSMTGTELAARAQAIRPGLPIVLVSANAAAIDTEAARRGGVRRVLAKPVAAETLKSVLAELLPEASEAREQ